MKLVTVAVTSMLLACTMPTEAEVDEPTPAPVDDPVAIDGPEEPPVEGAPETGADPEPEPTPEPPAFVPAAGCVYVLDAYDAIVYEAGPYDTARSYDMRHRAYSTYVVPDLNATGDNPPYRVVGSRP